MCVLLADLGANIDGAFQDAFGSIGVDWVLGASKPSQTPTVHIIIVLPVTVWVALQDNFVVRN